MRTSLGVRSLLLLAALVVATPAGAGTYYWNVVNPATGYISDVANWSLADGTAGMVPTTGDTAYFKNTGVAYVDATHLFLGAPANVYVGDGTPPALGEVFAPSAGHVMQSGGSLGYSTNLIVGQAAAPGTSTYDLSGGSIVQTGATGGGEFTVGKSSTATMTMSGSATVSRLNVGNSYTNIGALAGGNGTLTMGDTSALNLGARLYIGGDSTGAAGATGSVTLNNSAKITISGHATADRNRLYVGFDGTGSLTLNNSTSLTVGQRVYVGANTTSGAPPVTIASATGTLTMTGTSTVTVGEQLRVGSGLADCQAGNTYYGEGTMNMYDSASATVNSSVNVGIFNYSRGWLNLYNSSKLTITGANILAVGDSNDLAGTYANAGPGGVGVCTVNDNATITAGGGVAVGNLNKGHGTMTIASAAGTATVDTGTGYCTIGAGGGEGTLNLNAGGVLKTSRVVLGTTFTWGSGGPNLGPYYGNGTLNFNGGTLVAKAGGISFIAEGASGVTSALNVKAGGAIIDSNGYSIVVQPTMVGDTGSPGGGLTKKGLGTLTLASGANSYTGATTVDAGTLLAYTESGPAGAVTVHTGATLLPAKWDLGANAIDTSSMGGDVAFNTSRINFDDGANLTVALLGEPGALAGATSVTTGVLAATGTTAKIGVDFAGVTPSAAGPFEIVNYSSKVGTTTFLPWVDAVGITTTTITDNGSSAVSVTFGNFDNHWTSAGPNSDYSTTSNWSSYVPTGANKRALFDGTGETVDLNMNATLSSLTFNAGGFDLSPVSSYKLTMDSTIAINALINNMTGSNTISAPIALNKTTRATVAVGTDTLTLSGPISGVGGIDKQGAGTLLLSNSGSTFSGPITVKAGELEVSSAGALGAGTNAATDLVLGGTLQYTGAAGSASRGITIDGARTVQVDTAGVTLTLNGAVDAIGGALTKTGAGTLELSSSAATNGLGTPLTVKEGGLILDGAASGVTFTVSGNIVVGQMTASAASTGTLALTGSGSTIAAAVYLGYGLPNPGAGHTYVGDGALNMRDSASLTANGVVEVGLWNFSQGQINLYDSSTLTVAGANNLIVGDSNDNGGLYLNPGPGGVGAMTVNDNATVTVGGALRVGAFNTGHGTMTIASTTGTATVDVTGAVTIGYGGGGGTLTLGAGGRLLAPAVALGTISTTYLGNGTLTFDGGTLVAKASSGTFVAPGGTGVTASVLVQSHGAIIDTNGYDDTITTALVEDTGSTGGGLTKKGTGKLTLTGANTYSGDTIVQAGTLSINAAMLDDDADLSIAIAAVMDLNFTGTDTIGGLLLGGAAQALGTWGATGSGAAHINDTYFTGAGTVLVTAVNVLIPGDTNNDLIVDATDAGKLAQYWGATVGIGDYAKGDFNGDGKVNAADASILAANWGSHTGEGAGAVPEPSILVLLLAGSLVAVLRRQR